MATVWAGENVTSGGVWASLLGFVLGRMVALLNSFFKHSFGFCGFSKNVIFLLLQ